MASSASWSSRSFASLRRFWMSFIRSWYMLIFSMSMSPARNRVEYSPVASAITMTTT